MAFKVIIGPGRLSYPNLFVPQEQDNGGEDKYSTALLLPPDFDVGPLRAALQDAWMEKFGADPKKWPKNAREPKSVIKDVDTNKYGPEFEGWRLVNCAGYTAPGVVNAMREDIDEKDGKKEVYPGRWARISVAAYGYEAKGNKGVTLGLNNVQLLKHDTPIAGRTRAQDDFDYMPDEDEGWS